MQLRPIFACPFDHPKCRDEKKKEKTTKKREKEAKGRDNQYSPSGDAFTQTRLMSAFWVSTGFHVEHRRPKAGDAPHEGLLKLKGGGLGV